MSFFARLNRRYLLRYRLEYAAALFVFHVARSLSPQFAWRLARGVAALLFRFGVKRKILLTNLSIAFPELSEAEREELGRRTMEHFGSLVIDVLFQRRMVRRSNFYRRFDITGWSRDYLKKHGEEGLRQRSHGVMFVTAHLGNWELASGFFSMLGVSIAPVYRSPQNPFLDKLVRKIRLDSQFETIEKRGAVRTMIDHLEAGGNIGFLFDQEAGHGLYVPFFGKPACTHKTPAVLARNNGVKILFGVVLRHGDFFRYEARGELLDLQRETGNPDADLTAITADLMGRLENDIREFPEQYLWMHRRWKRSGVHG